MKPLTRVAALRALFGSVVTSDLNPSEILDLARELRQGNLPLELAFMLEDFADGLGRGAPQKSPQSQMQRDDVSSALEIAKRKRLPKTRLLDAIRAFLPANIANRVDSSMEMSEIFQKVYTYGSPSDFSKLVSVLEAGNVRDPYLSGITSRSKDKQG